MILEHNRKGMKKIQCRLILLGNLLNETKESLSIAGGNLCNLLRAAVECGGDAINDKGKERWLVGSRSGRHVERGEEGGVGFNHETIKRYFRYQFEQASPSNRIGDPACDSDVVACIQVRVEVLASASETVHNGRRATVLFLGQISLENRQEALVSISFMQK